MRKVSGTARPAAPALACGLMFAAMLGALSATTRPTADQTVSERLRPGPPDGFASIYASLLDFVPIVSLHPTRYGRGKKYESTIQPAPFPCPPALCAPIPARRAPLLPPME